MDLLRIIGVLLLLTLNGTNVLGQFEPKFPTELSVASIREDSILMIKFKTTRKWLLFNRTQRTECTWFEKEGNMIKTAKAVLDHRKLFHWVDSYEYRSGQRVAGRQYSYEMAFGFFRRKKSTSTSSFTYHDDIVRRETSTHFLGKANWISTSTREWRKDRIGPTLTIVETNDKGASDSAVYRYNEYGLVNWADQYQYHDSVIIERTLDSLAYDTTKLSYTSEHRTWRREASRWDKMTCGCLQPWRPHLCKGMTSDGDPYVTTSTYDTKGYPVKRTTRYGSGKVLRTRYRYRFHAN